MCGVFAALLKQPLTSTDIARARHATAAMIHRGPDGAGEWMDVEGGVYLGHRRLAIVDLSEASSQPMAIAGSVIAYNGEVYNFREIRDRLAGKGQRFQTSGDVEVVLKAWQDQGADCLDWFDGMFAFVIWNGREAHIAVDPFGEKPIFVADTSAGLWVSSEIGPLARALDLEPDIDDSAVAAFMCLGNFPAPLTAYRQIQKIPPATVMRVRVGEVVSTRRYWSMPTQRLDRGPVAEVSAGDLDRVTAILCESIERRLIADVPLGLFLSSGIDSSLIASITSRELGRKLECLTVGFPAGSVADEAEDAARIAAHLDLPHRIFQSREDASVAGPNALLELFGQPSENVSAFPVLQLARAVTPAFKVALTGIGGDEFTAGYGKHSALYENRHRYKVFSSLMGRASGVVPKGIAQAVPGVFAQFLIRPSEAYLALKNYPTIAWLRDLQGYDAFLAQEFAEFRGPPFSWIPQYEKASILPNEHLAMLDLASMRSSLELRSPFLHRGLAETLAHFDIRSLVAFGQKSLLRRILGRYLPTELFDLPKRGFRFPQERFLKNRGDGSLRLEGVALPDVEEIWRRRFDGKGWERIALRLVALETFLNHPVGRRLAASNC